MDFQADKPTLIIGMPRSGTTWIGTVLNTAYGTRLISEPDNEKGSPLAWLSKRDVHRFPYLTPQDHAEDYETMWRAILSGAYREPAQRLFRRFYLRRRQPALEAWVGDRTGVRYINTTLLHVPSKGNVPPLRPDPSSFQARWMSQALRGNPSFRNGDKLLIKSVHAPLCMEWLASKFAPNLCVVLRNPHSIFASYKRLRLPDRYRNLLIQPALQRDFPGLLSDSRLYIRDFTDCMQMQIVLMLKIMQLQIRNHPEWTLISHDRFCIDPQIRFEHLYSQIDLKWTTTVKDKIADLNRSGEGFKPVRVAQLQPMKWRTELTEAEISSMDRWISKFELTDFLKEQILT
jgi:hypothetical protein